MPRLYGKILRGRTFLGSEVRASRDLSFSYARSTQRGPAAGGDYRVRTVAGLGRRRDRQDSRGNLPDRPLDRPRHSAAAHSGCHVHEQSGGRDAAARQIAARPVAEEVPEISTFHSLCVRILRRHIKRLGYPEKFAIYDQGDQDGLAGQILREINVPTAQLRPSDLLYRISLWKSRGIRPDQAVTVAATDREHLAAIAYRRYQRALRLAGAVDFDDLLLLTEDLFQQFPQARRAEAGRFDHILVDEYQDTNASQYRILLSLAVGHRNLCVVGDDDQSIYGWRGADVRHILRFTDDWPDARIVRLEENYRCTQAILEWANRLIRHNRVRHDKTLQAARPGGEKPRVLQFRDETEEAEQIVGDVARRLARGDCTPGDFAILFRTNEQPRSFETELRRAQIPYVLIGGMSFFDRKEVRDLLAYLRVLVAPQDEPSLLRIINTPPRGIGPQAVQAVLQEAVGRGCPVWDVLPTADRLAGVSGAAAESIHAFVRLVRDFQRRAAKSPLTACVQDLIREVGYEAEIQRRYGKDVDAVQARWRTVEEVVNSLSDYAARAPQPSLRAFLDEIQLTSRDQETDKQQQLRRNAVVLLTLHMPRGWSSLRCTWSVWKRGCCRIAAASNPKATRSMKSAGCVTSASRALRNASRCRSP